MFDVGPWAMPTEKHGSWWLPETPDRPLPGTLSYTADGLRLKCPATPPFHVPTEAGSKFVVHGLVDGEDWTLGDCSLIRRGASGQTFHVDFALEGLRMDAPELNDLDEICFSLDGLWSVVAAIPRDLRSTDRASVALRANLTDGNTLGLTSGIELIDAPEEGTTAFVDRLVFVGRSPVSVPLGELLKTYFAPIRDLVMLALQKGTSLTYCMVSGNGTTYELHGEKCRAAVNAYWDPIGTPRNRVRASPPALEIPTDPTDFEILMRRWFALYEAIETPMGLRLADLVSEIGYSEPRFLFVAQALEALHRRLYPDAHDDLRAAARDHALDVVDEAHRASLEALLLHAHEPSFRRRLKDLANEVLPRLEEVIGQRPAPAINGLVEMRNRVTHWDPSAPVATGVELAGLRQFADAVFDLVIVTRLELPEAASRRVVSAHRAKNVAYWLDRAITELEAE